MPGENEFYAAEKIARKICAEEMQKCLKGNAHEIKIENIEREVETMKKSAKDTADTIFSKLDAINGKFLTIAVTAVMELLAFIGAIVMFYLQTNKGG